MGLNYQGDIAIDDFFVGQGSCNSLQPDLGLCLDMFLPSPQFRPESS